VATRPTPACSAGAPRAARSAGPARPVARAAPACGRGSAPASAPPARAVVGPRDVAGVAGRPSRGVQRGSRRGRRAACSSPRAAEDAAVLAFGKGRPRFGARCAPAAAGAPCLRLRAAAAWWRGRGARGASGGVSGARRGPACADRQGLRPPLPSVAAATPERAARGRLRSDPGGLRRAASGRSFAAGSGSRQWRGMRRQRGDVGSLVIADGAAVLEVVALHDGV
jgi:hypothetical protein